MNRTYPDYSIKAESSNKPQVRKHSVSKCLDSLNNFRIFPDKQILACRHEYNRGLCRNQYMLLFLHYSPLNIKINAKTNDKC